MGCGPHIPKVSVFDSKEFYDKVMENPSYKEEFELQRQPGEPNCFIYRGTTFSYDGFNDTGAIAGSIYDSVYATSPMTGRTYNLNRNGFGGIVAQEPGISTATIWKFSIWSIGTKHLKMMKAKS
jgi:hypothetical protein